MDILVPMNSTILPPDLDRLLTPNEALESSTKDIASSSTSANETENPYRQGVWATLAWSLAYGVMVLVGLLGNMGICWIVYFNKRMRTVTNFFLANTAVADALVVVFNTVFNFTYALNNEWYFGAVFCRFINFLPVASVCASILSITIISLDRFVVIMYPFRRRISKTEAKIILVAIWVMSLGLCFPQAYFSVEREVEGRRRLCDIKWPNGPYSLNHMIYQSTFMAVSYFLPLIILAISYIFLGKKLWGTQSMAVGDLNYSHHQKLKNNRKAVKMMMFVVITFAVCWLPYHLFFIIGFSHPELFKWAGVQQIYLSVFWVAMSSTMYNPFIYCWNNHRFRSEFKKLLMLQCRRNGIGGDQTTMYSQNRHSLIQKTEITRGEDDN